MIEALNLWSEFLLDFSPLAYIGFFLLHWYLMKSRLGISMVIFYIVVKFVLFVTIIMIGMLVTDAIFPSMVRTITGAVLGGFFLFGVLVLFFFFEDKYIKKFLK